MRGTEKKQATMLTLLSPDRVVPEKDPLRRVKALADAALRELSPVFDEMYSAVGRPSIQNTWRSVSRGSARGVRPVATSPALIGEAHEP